jgi:hypothetical protein
VTHSETPDASGAAPPRARHQGRLPGFIVEQATGDADGVVGLGDIVKRATLIAGVRPCGPCSERARRLNAWMTFSAGNRR